MKKNHLHWGTEWLEVFPLVVSSLLCFEGCLAEGDLGLVLNSSTHFAVFMAGVWEQEVQGLIIGCHIEREGCCRFRWVYKVYEPALQWLVR